MRALREVLLSWGILEVEILSIIQVLSQYPSTISYGISIGCITLWLVNGMHTLLITIEALSIMPKYGQQFNGYASRAFGHHIDTFGVLIMPRFGK